MISLPITIHLCVPSLLPLMERWKIINKKFILPVHIRLIHTQQNLLIVVNYFLSKKELGQDFLEFLKEMLWKTLTITHLIV